MMALADIYLVPLTNLGNRAKLPDSESQADPSRDSQLEYVLALNSDSLQIQSRSKLGSVIENQRLLRYFSWLVFHYRDVTQL